LFHGHRVVDRPILISLFRKNFSFDKLLNHFVLDAAFYPGDRVKLIVGYNFLRRVDPGIGYGCN
jgi:hypothetical protein